MKLCDYTKDCGNFVISMNCYNSNEYLDMVIELLSIKVY